MKPLTAYISTGDKENPSWCLQKYRFSGIRWSPPSKGFVIFWDNENHIGNFTMILLKALPILMFNRRFTFSKKRAKAITHKNWLALPESARY